MSQTEQSWFTKSQKKEKWKKNPARGLCRRKMYQECLRIPPVFKEHNWRKLPLLFSIISFETYRSFACKRFSTKFSKKEVLKRLLTLRSKVSLLSFGNFGFHFVTRHMPAAPCAAKVLSESAGRVPPRASLGSVVAFAWEKVENLAQPSTMSREIRAAGYADPGWLPIL